jgi:hypothetical protein
MILALVQDHLPKERPADPAHRLWSTLSLRDRQTVLRATGLNACLYNLPWHRIHASYQQLIVEQIHRFADWSGQLQGNPVVKDNLTAGEGGR